MTNKYDKNVMKYQRNTNQVWAQKNLTILNFFWIHRMFQSEAIRLLTLFHFWSWHSIRLNLSYWQWYSY